MRKEETISVKARVGLFALSGLFLLIFALLMITKPSWLYGGYQIVVNFGYVDDLREGAMVKIAGGPLVGQVENVIPGKNGGVDVLIRFSSGVKVNRDASFHIYATSLIGEKYIDILHYTGQPPYITNGERIKGVTPLGLNRGLEQLGHLARVLGLSVEGGTGASGQLKETFQSLAYTIKNIGDIASETRKGITHIVDSLKSSAEETKKFTQRLNKIIDKIDTLVSNLNSTTVLARRKISALNEKNISDALKNIDQTTKELKLLISELRKSEVKRLVRDKEVVEKLKRAVDNFEEFSRKIKEDPSVLIWGTRE